MLNIVDIVLAVLVLLLTLEGFKRGLLRSLCALLEFVVGVPLAFYVSDKYHIAVYDTYVRDKALEKVTEKLSSAADVDAFVKSVETGLAKLPHFLTDSLDLSVLDQVNAQSAADVVMRHAVRPVAMVLIEIALFLTTLVVVGILFGILCWLVTGRQDRHAPLRQANSVLGGVFGFCKGAALVMTLAAIAVYLEKNAVFDPDGGFMKQVAGSAVFEYINTFNPLIQFI